ncbi:MAG: glycosyltransferase, partial [Caulobacteraceae bacterium]
MNAGLLLAGACLTGWGYLLFLRGGFWLARERDDRLLPTPRRAVWPSVTAVVPARNEADVIGISLASLLAQDYRGRYRIILVDDASADGTADAALDLSDPERRLEILPGTPLPAGWTGKLWAAHQGIQRASAATPDFLLLTDADIAHAPDNVTRLVVRAQDGGLALTSLMAKLTVQTLPERALIPAFVFFFAMLYPFAWVGDPRRRAAAAAGGCMLVRRTALEEAGGLASIASEIIDDCALAARLKRQGPIWIGLSERARSLRPYRSFAQIGAMVARSAYAQLRYSPLALALALAGMALIFLAGPAVAILASGPPRWLGLASWFGMALAFQPMLRFYRASPLWGVALPAVAAGYAAITLRSAV